MLVAQITDTHIRAGGAFAFDRKADTSARLAAAVRFLAGHTPRPDVVLATGDLADSGRAGDYRALVELLLSGDGPRGFVDTPPMVGLHLWREGDGLVTHVAAADEPDRLTAFAKG